MKWWIQVPLLLIDFFGLLTFMDEFDRNCMQVRKRVPTKFFEHVGALAGGSPKSLWPQWSLALVIFPSSKASARRQLRGCTSKRMLQKIWMDLFLLTTYSDQWLQLFRKHQRNKWWPSALRRRIFFYARSSALGCLTRLEARSASEDVKPPKPTGGHKLHKPWP